MTLFQGLWKRPFRQKIFSEILFNGFLGLCRFLRKVLMIWDLLGRILDGRCFRNFIIILRKFILMCMIHELLWLIDRHARLKVEKVNTWGLVYTLNGSNIDLKPS